MKPIDADNDFKGKHVRSVVRAFDRKPFAKLVPFYLLAFQQQWLHRLDVVRLGRRHRICAYRIVGRRCASFQRHSMPNRMSMATLNLFVPNSLNHLNVQHPIRPTMVACCQMVSSLASVADSFHRRLASFSHRAQNSLTLDYIALMWQQHHSAWNSQVIFLLVAHSPHHSMQS